MFGLPYNVVAQKVYEAAHERSVFSRHARTAAKVDRRYSLDMIFDEIQKEMRSQYSLAYSPANGQRDGSFRKLEIKTKAKDLKVQARKGYYATAAR